jgi:hypothetical protein
MRIAAEDYSLLIELLESRLGRGDERVERLGAALRLQREIAILMEREREALERLAK